MKNFKLKDLLSEKHLGYSLRENDDEELEPISLEERNQFLTQIKEFNTVANSIFRNVNYRELSENMGKLVEFASRFTVEQAGDWFDGVTVKRHMKRIQEDYDELSKTAKDMHVLQQRLENCYENIGQVLNRYYEIDDPNIDGDDEESVDRNMKA